MVSSDRLILPYVKASGNANRCIGDANATIYIAFEYNCVKRTFAFEGNCRRHALVGTSKNTHAYTDQYMHGNMHATYIHAYEYRVRG